MSPLAPASGAIEELEACNARSSPFGLILSRQQALALNERRAHALKATGRVEFGGGVLEKLVDAFCASPHIMQENYEETLGELQDIFYYFKSESMDAFSDDELIEAMESAFHGRARGSLEYLAGMTLENLCRAVRGGLPEDGRPYTIHDEEEYE